MLLCSKSHTFYSLMWNICCSVAAWNVQHTGNNKNKIKQSCWCIMEENSSSLQPLEICKNEVSLVAWQPSWYWISACYSHCSCRFLREISFMDGGLNSIRFSARELGKSWREAKLLTFSCFSSTETQGHLAPYPGKLKPAVSSLRLEWEYRQHGTVDVTSHSDAPRWVWGQNCARQRKRWSHVPLLFPVS